MATVTGYTAERMQEIINTTIQSGSIDGNGHLILTTYDGTLIDAGPVLGTVPDASVTVKGIVELATIAEATAGTDSVRAVTPDGLKAAIDALKELIWPIGAYYWNEVDPTDPATILGFGTWSPVSARFIIGHDGSTYVAGNEGGNATHTIASANLPTHTHAVSLTSGNASADHTHGVNINTGTVSADHAHSVPNVISPSGSGSGAFFESWPGGTGSRNHFTSGITANHIHNVNGNTGGASGNHTHSVSGNTGNGGFANTPINHVPPWRAAYIWRRTA